MAARRLGQPRTEPILEVRSIMMTGKRAIDHTVARFCAGRVSCFSTIDRKSRCSDFSPQQCNRPALSRAPPLPTSLRPKVFEVKEELAMISPAFRTIVLAGALASASIAESAGAAVARTSYDGSWSVLIVTDSGPCNRTYRYGVEISDGTVFYAGDGPVNLQGRVARNGAIRVRVVAGDQWADGSGRLFRDHGGGYWHGQGPTGACAGRWDAQRREW
jgi:hypothetical protein